MDTNLLINQQNKIRVLLVDDEVKACTNLKNILENYIVEHRLEIVGIAHNTKDAEQLIKQHQPDALFLDIEMPNENAFQFLDRISPFKFQVIFVTAYDEYAIKAFKINALDYILKPISIVELKASIQKLLDKTDSSRILNQYEDLTEIGQNIKSKKTTQYLKLRSNEAIEIVQYNDILFIEAMGAYSKFFIKNKALVKEILVCHIISEYEELLPNSTFYRVHRSYLINCLNIDNLKLFDGHLELSLSSHLIQVSRRRMNDFLDYYNNLVK